MTLIRSGLRRRPDSVLGAFVVKSKVCQNCKRKFTPDLPGAIACSESCAIAHAVSVNGKARKVAQVKDRRETKDKLAKLKTRGQWQAEAQASVNAFVRLRDAHLPCVSCGRHHEGQWHAGHYRSVGSAPHLRFDVERNLHRQCQPCNTHLHGNLVLYRQELIRRIGLAVVESLEADQAPRNYTVDDLQAMKAEYAAKARALLKAQT